MLALVDRGIGAPVNLRNLVIAAALLCGAWQLKVKLWPRHVPAVSFTDVQGLNRSFSRSTKPAVVGFWIQECGYSQRMMRVLRHVRQRYPGEQLDVIAFELNSMPDSQISAIASREGYQMGATLAGAQNTPGLIQTLQDGFAIRGPGRDVYVIDKNGRLRTVPAVDSGDEPLDPAAVESAVDARIEASL